jgi:purine-binding chemotaxis protein CheW
MDAVVVRIAGRKVAVPAARVREVAQVSTVTPVPQAKAQVLGLTQIRGHILPVLDVAPEAQRTARPGDPLLVVELGPVRAALLVDGVEGVESDPPHELMDVGSLFDLVRAP